MNSLLYDKNSRYNSVDNTNIVFFTPNQIKDMDIGFDLSMFKDDEMDRLFPFLVDTLKEMVKETTLGDRNGSDVEFPVENSDTKVFVCIEINGKFCKLQTEEWDITNNFRGLPCHLQVKVFQRLLAEQQITLDDLAAEDIDNSVYKKLVVNDISGMQLYQRKLDYLDRTLERQSKDKAMLKRKERVISNL